MAGAMMMAQMSWHSAETELLSPTNLGADVWVDFSDPTSYTTAGSTITAVTDKASNFTLTVNGTPTTGTTLNSLATATFDGNENAYTVAQRTVRDFLNNKGYRILGEEYRDKEFTGKDICRKRDIDLYFNKRDHRFSSSDLRKRVCEHD